MTKVRLGPIFSVGMFGAAGAIFILALTEGFYLGLSLLPWIVAAWVVGMLVTLIPGDREAVRKARITGAVVFGAILLYIGLYLSLTILGRRA